MECGWGSEAQRDYPRKTPQYVPIWSSGGCSRCPDPAFTTVGNTQYRPDRNRLGFSREKDRQTGVDTKLDVLRHLRTLVPRQ